MRQFLFIIFHMVAISCIAADPVFTCNFQSGVIDDYLNKSKKGAVLAAMEDGAKCLEIATSTQIELKPIEVQPEKKYKLSFKGRIEGEDSVEKNGWTHIKTIRTYGRYAGGYHVLFYDKDNKIINEGVYKSSGFIITNNWYDYVNVFYTPVGTKSIIIQFRAKKQPVFITDIVLEEENSENTINCNPDFRYGELNYNGWRAARGGRLYKRPDGKTVFKSGYAGGTPRIPMRDDSAYKIFVRGKGQSKKGWITLYFFDKNKKRLGSRFLLRPKPEGGSVELIPPPGTKSGWGVMYSVIIDEFRVTRLGDKSILTEKEKKK